ncbi:hypothetical protein DH2020_043229 [Rehmannia glutinosa]|uniref:HhH-GPD domain-containing protein n=1 Tax=Rehmannia glutinosa TaxID=99300 RepID=A0ABR0UL52_REHGL
MKIMKKKMTRRQNTGRKRELFEGRMMNLSPACILFKLTNPSNAFMSLAAKYPPPSLNEHNQVKIAKPQSDECDQIFPMEKAQIVEPPFREYDQLLPIEKAQIGVDPMDGNKTSSPRRKKGKLEDKQEITNWDELRVKYSQDISKDRTDRTNDSVNWEAVRQTSVRELAKVILKRGMNNLLAQRIKDFLDRLVRDHGSIDLEWLRDVPPDKAKEVEYLLSISGLGLKSVECVRLLTLHHRAFPVDVNISRVLVRYGWVPLQTLPENVLIHLLNQYPELDSVQKFLWPRIEHIKQRKLYQVHYHLILFGKTMCTKRRPNCKACPLRAKCRHYASMCASANRLPDGSRGENMSTMSSISSGQNSMMNATPSMLFNVDGDFSEGRNNSRDCEPIIEFPASPMHESTEIVDACAQTLDIEDLGSEDEMTTTELNDKKLIKTLLNCMDREDDLSKALVALGPEVAAHYRPKLKHVERLRTEHHVYELPDSHPLLARLPCRTTNRGSFPLNGTYFQVNEVFADDESSQQPIDVPREWVWNLRRRAYVDGSNSAYLHQRLY